MILSGEANFGKTELRALSESPKEELAAIATAIENGTAKETANGSAK